MPAPILADVLKQSGWTQEQIDALDAQAKTGLTNYVSNIYQTAEQKETTAREASAKAEADRKASEEAVVAAKEAQEKAELEHRSALDFWNNTFSPGMSAWEAEKSRLAKEAADARAESAFYKAQRESYLGTLGIEPANAPIFTPSPTVVPPAPQDPNRTPGTPTFTINEVRDNLGSTLGTLTDIQWKYHSLYGKPMPISPTELVRQSEANKYKDPATYASQIFKFSEKEAEIRQSEHKKELDAYAAAATAEKEKLWKEETDKLKAEFNAKERLRAEQSGSNPDVKLPPGSSKFSELQRATKAGERKDPTKMTPLERRQSALDNIHKAIEERQSVVA
jgi:hypothetical protein